MKISTIISIVCFMFLGVYASQDASRNVSQIIQARGYPFEDHAIVTPDKFILSVQRITGKRYSAGSPHSVKPVVLLQHGLEDSSISWVIQENVYQSLGFILADAGFDVWMSNSRGNYYSTQNTVLNPSEDKFWAWSFDEMITYDFPTLLKYITSTTKKASIGYVGHSQGTIAGFGTFSKYPDMMKKVNVFVALAPVAWISNTKSILLKFLADTSVAEILKLLGEKDFTPNTKLIQELFPAFCKVDPAACEFALGTLMGYDNSDLNKTRLPDILAHVPAGTSVQNMLHYSQLVSNGKFQMYDYGSAASNNLHYNQSTPPQYDPTRVTLPTALFYGGHDDLADTKDVLKLIPYLPNIVFNNFEPQYSHVDYIWGDTAYIKVYADVLRLLQKYAV